MSEIDRTGPRTTLSVFAAAVAVVAWRIFALELLRADGTSLVIPTLLAVVGVTFLACGLFVFRKVPGKASLLFVVFCICSGLHWGGYLELEPGEFRSGLILFYLLVSGTLGATVFLQLALEFPKRSPLADHRTLVRLLYLPVVLSAVLAVLFVASSSEGSLRTDAQQWFLLLHTIASNLFSILALALIFRRMFGTGMNTIQKRYVGLMVAGMLAAWLPYIVASVAGVQDTDPWNLSVIALPVSFAIAFFGIQAAAGSGQQL